MIAQRDATIADQAKVNERLSSELKWHGLDSEALIVVDGFATWKRARQGDKCWRVYERVAQPMLRLLGKLPCLQVDGERWGEHRTTRLAEPCGKDGKSHPSSSLLDFELTIAKMLFRWLMGAGKIPRNPLDIVKRKNEPNARETWLEVEDVTRLHDGAGVLEVDQHKHSDPRRVVLFRAWLLVKFGCALRMNEALPLRRDRIGKDGVVELSAKATKGKKRRTIVIPANALAAVRAVPALRNEPQIFTHEWNGEIRRVSEDTMRDWFYRVCKATGVSTRAADGEKVVPHVLRHSAASHAEAMGAHPSDIQQFLDHASIKTTERYLHRRPAQRAQAMAALMSKKAEGAA